MPMDVVWELIGQTRVTRYLSALKGYRIETALKLGQLFSKSPRVYVDAKILKMHDQALQREAYVGYLVEGTGKQNAKRVDATESDDAEVLAILFAVEELKDSLGRFTVVCDHESVVSEANREGVKNMNPMMEQLRRTLRENPSVQLRVLQANPAHGIVTAYVNAQRGKLDSEPSQTEPPE